MNVLENTDKYLVFLPLSTTQNTMIGLPLSAPRCTPLPQVRRLPEGLLAHDLRGDVTAGAE